MKIIWCFIFFYRALFVSYIISLSLSFSLPARWSWSNESLQQWLYLLNSLRPKISLGAPICSCLCVCIRFFLCNTMLVASEKQPMRGSSCLCVFAWETDYIPQASLALAQWLTALSEFQSEHFVAFSEWILHCSTVRTLILLGLCNKNSAGMVT